MRESRRRFLRFLAASPLALTPSWPYGLHQAAGTSTADGALDVFDLESAARAALPPAHFGYLATGTDDDLTLRANRDAFGRYQLRVRRLVDVGALDLTTTLFGVTYASPLVMAPVGSLRAFHPDGELGAARVVPILSERTVIQVNEREAADKAEKLQPVAIEAIKQCGSPWLTKIEPPVSLKNFLARGDKFELPLVASLQEGSQHPRELIRQFRDLHQRLPVTACVWIGPEGDFSPAEMDLLRASGALPITLGRLVLRSDTAAIYSLSVMNYELQSSE